MPKISDKQRDERRRQILKAAFVCFARKGFHGTRVREICQEAELSPGAVYLYFEGKEAIVHALAEEAKAQSEALWEKTSQPSNDSGLGRIERLFELACSEKDPSAARMSVQFWAQAFDNEVLRKAMLADHDESVDEIARLLGSEGNLARSEAKALAELIIATLRGFGLQKAIVPTIDLAPAARVFIRALRGELAATKTATKASRESVKKSGGHESRRHTRQEENES